MGRTKLKMKWNGHVALIVEFLLLSDMSVLSLVMCYKEVNTQVFGNLFEI